MAKTKDGEVQVSCKVPEILHREVKSLASLENRTITEIVTLAFTKYLQGTL